MIIAIQIGLLLIVSILIGAGTGIITNIHLLEREERSNGSTAQKIALLRLLIFFVGIFLSFALMIMAMKVRAGDPELPFTLLVIILWGAGMIGLQYLYKKKIYRYESR